MDGWPEQSSPGTIDSEEATEEKWKRKWKRERPRPSRGREAGGGRRETRGSNLERLKRLKKEGDEMRRRRPMGVEGDARGGCSGSKRTDPFFFNRKERGANPSGRRPSGDEDWVVPSAMGILEAPLHWGSRCPPQGGPPSTPQALKRGHGHLHLEAGEARHFASLSRPPTASSTTMKRVSGVCSVERTLPLTFPCRFPPPFSIHHLDHLDRFPTPAATTTDVGRSIWPLSKLSEILEAR